MGYNTAFLMVEGVTAAGASGLLDALFDAADLFAPAANEADLDGVDFEAASSQFLHPNLALGAAGGWAVLWDPNAQLRRSDFPQAVSRGRRALACRFGSVDSRYGFHYSVDGVLRRAAVFQGNAVEESVGAALPEEAGLAAPVWGPDEDYLFEIMARLTGVSQGDLEAATYQVLEFLG